MGGYAASAAAIIGLMLSDHENVTLGGAAAVDENLLFEDPQPTRAKSEEAKPKPSDEKQSHTDEPLVPWIRLK